MNASKRETSKQINFIYIYKVLDIKETTKVHPKQKHSTKESGSISFSNNPKRTYPKQKEAKSWDQKKSMEQN